MAQSTSPSIATSGLMFYYDMNNKAKSWLGAPTTNLSSGIGIGTYLNTPSDVTSSLTQTTELYKGQPVYKQVLTPITATGVSQLTNAGNPGIGVVTGGGGGAAAKYTGHSIFFKPALGRAGLNSSTPIYTHYSNIGGWQSSGNYDDMGDGWYRAHVIYYNASGGSDGKYWAINPAGAALNVPITIYWAAPFKEDRNDSTFVSAYTFSSRSNTQSVKDLINISSATTASLVYNSDSTFQFSYTNPNYIEIPLSTAFNKTEGTMDFWVYPTRYNGGNGYFVNRQDSSANAVDWFWIGPYSDTFYFRIGNGTDCCSNDLSFGSVSVNIPLNTWTNMCFTWKSNGTSMIYKNGVQFTSRTIGNIPSTNPASIGRIGLGHGNADDYFNGKIPSVKIYNRQLTSTEIRQNFNASRGIYNI